MTLSKVPRGIQFLLWIVVIQVIIFSVLRLSFLISFNDSGDPLSSLELVKAFYIGFKFDFRLALICILPALFLAWIRPISLFSGLGKKIWLTCFISQFSGVISICFLHFGYYSYLRIPLDATILRFLNNAGESWGMVWESYPVIKIFTGIFIVTGFYGWIVQRIHRRFSAKPEIKYRRSRKVMIVMATVFFVLCGLYGKWSFYPLRWSDAYFSPHPFAAAVTVNPVLHFFSTLKNKEVQFNKLQVEKYYDVMSDYLGVDRPDKKTMNFQRTRQGTELSRHRPNIVMVFLESFASYKTTTAGNPLNPTPNFAAISKDALYFKNFFIPHTGTARSVFCAITGLPDVETIKTSTRNPLIIDQHTIINSFTDYQNFYFIGGSASWGNIRGLLSRNIKGVKIYEEGNYKSKRVDVWGISDLHLFAEANSVLKKKKDKPFFAIIQTAGNHKPYNIPEDNRGFIYSGLKDEQVTSYGFESAREFDSFRYMDHSVGYFMKIARKEQYFANTIFIFFGDHGIYGDTGKHTPLYEHRLAIQSFHVPLVIYAPKLIKKGQTFDTVASGVDILPTLAGLASEKYVNTTIGRDLLDNQHENTRYAFTVHHGNGLTIGLLDENYYFRMRDSGNNKVLYSLHSDKPRNNIILQKPDQAILMEKYCSAIFETSRYMRFHNQSRYLP